MELNAATPTEPFDGSGMEIQLTGAGLTPYSRMAFGRAVLRSSIREFLCSQVTAALGVATTRALRVTGSDAPAIRETVETAAVMTRVAPGFLRFGHFEHVSYQSQHERLGELAIRAARKKDFYELRQLQPVLENPFDEDPDFEAYAGFPPDCATAIEISCSS
jgi:uncharacterized protein YdiU (UPF0061 family)